MDSLQTTYTLYPITETVTHFPTIYTTTILVSAKVTYSGTSVQPQDTASLSSFLSITTAPPQITTALSPELTLHRSGSTTSSSQSIETLAPETTVSENRGLSTGAKAGIGVGIGVACLLLIVGLLFFCLRRKAIRASQRRERVQAQQMELQQSNPDWTERYKKPMREYSGSV